MCSEVQGAKGGAGKSLSLGQKAQGRAGGGEGVRVEMH